MGRRSARKDLSHILATHLQLCEAAGPSPEEAEDLTQGFFELMLERRDLDSVRKERGRLRSYLLASLKHFTADRRRRDMAIKRGRRQGLIPLEELRANERVDLASRDRWKP